MIPNIAVVHVHNPYWRGFRLWVPLFLLWIPLLLLSPLHLLVVGSAAWRWGQCVACRRQLSGRSCAASRVRMSGCRPRGTACWFGFCWGLYGRRASFHSFFGRNGASNPGEAERLLAVTTYGREGGWMVAACIAATAAQIHLHAVLPVLARLEEMLPQGSLKVLHSGLFMLTQCLGGRS